MATMMSKEEYLKRYLSGPSDDGKKKKRKKRQAGVKQSRNMIIHDDDIDAKTLTPGDLKESDVDKLNTDEAPLVADFVDERPKDEIHLEQFRKSNKWKLSMNKDDEDENDQSQRHRDETNRNRKQHAAKSRHDSSDSDDGDPLTLNRTRHDSSDSDMSPIRTQRADAAAPSRRTRHDSDSDLSPPRRGSTKGNQRTKGKVQNSDGDLSPPRRQRNDDSKRQRNDDSKRRKRNDSDSDLSPPRRKRNGSDSDLSPPRRKKQDSDSDLSPPRRPKDKPAAKSRLEQMSSGAKAGLQDARTMRKENDATKRRNVEMFAHMTDEMSGRNAETVFRDRSSGRTRNLKMEKLKKREEEQKKAEEDEKFMQWGKGMAQQKEKESNLQDHLHEMSKPMARYRDDTDLDSMLKDKDREGDPMLAFMKKKQAKNNAKLGIKEKPKYRGPAPPPTRFNICPGYRWDGVDRSNGFEKKFFLRAAEKKATSEIAYKWSIEDM